MLHDKGQLSDEELAFTKRVALPGAHPDGVTGLCWEGEDSFLSAGSDGCIRRWTREG